MAGNQVQGKNAAMEVNYLGTYYLIGCQVGFTFTYANENILRTDVNSPGYRKRRTRISDVSGNVNGVTTTTNTPFDDKPTVSVFYFLQEAVRRAPQDIRFTWEDDDGLVKEIVTTMLIETINIDGNVGDASKFDMSLVGGGGLSVDPIIPPDGGDEGFSSDYWNTTPGGQTITGVGVNGRSFAGKDVLAVFREGLEHTVVTGTPGNREAQFVSPNITFDIPFEDDVRVTVVWKDL